MRSTNGLRENAAFNRWLAEYETEVVVAERERIITAIKPLISKGYFPPEEVGTGDWLEIEFSEFVALMKGDKK
jgi:hypothetical protein